MKVRDSNMVVIMPTVFTNFPTGEVRYGARIWDDYEQTYVANLTCIPDTEIELIATLYRTSDDQVHRLLMDAAETGLYVGDMWFSGNEIEEILLECISEENEEEIAQVS